MKENFTLVLSSQNATNRTGSLRKNYQYYVNWDTVLNKTYNINKKYLVRFSFISVAQASLIAEVY